MLLGDQWEHCYWRESSAPGPVCLAQQQIAKGQLLLARWPPPRFALPLRFSPDERGLVSSPPPNEPVVSYTCSRSQTYDCSPLQGELRAQSSGGNSAELSGMRTDQLSEHASPPFWNSSYLMAYSVRKLQTRSVCQLVPIAFIDQVRHPEM